MTRVEELLAEAGDVHSSPEDPVRPDSAELAAMELGRMVVFSSDVQSAPPPQGFPRRRRQAQL